MKSVNIFCNFFLFTSITLVQANIHNNNVNSPVTYSPENGWVNDPNGLVYVDGTYHLFYQYSPGSDQPKNICWGHAESSDLVDWKDKGVAIPYNETTKEERYSGSAVYDRKNTSGFGIDSAPIVAVYTSNYAEDSTFPDGSPVAKGTQCQSIAYSQDKGKTWHTYRGNPVIKSPPPQYSGEYQNFRDPSVFWYQPQGKWVMVTVLSMLKKALFYSSTNLKDWTYMSEFSSQNTPTDVVWECPDMYEMEVLQKSETKWVLSFSVAARGGGVVCYIVGDFDGTKFVENVHKMDTIKSIDYGSDFYAGATWNNVGSLRLLIGWVDNWSYATKITNEYRGGLSLVREVKLVKNGDDYKLIQKPIKAIYNYVKAVHHYTKDGVENGIEIARNNTYDFLINIKGVDKTHFSLVIEDEKKNEEAKIHYDHKNKIIYLQKINMDPSSRRKLTKHRAKFDAGFEMVLNMFIDNNTLTLFCNNGEIVFTELLISNSKIRKLKLCPGSTAKINVDQFLLAMN